MEINRRVGEAVKQQAAFYRGEVSAAMPPSAERYEETLNPYRNGQAGALRAIGEELKHRSCGARPQDLLDALRESYMCDVVGAVESVFRCDECHEIRLVLDEFSTCMAIANGGNPCLQCRRIDEYMDRLVRCLCGLSRAGYRKHTEMCGRQKTDHCEHMPFNIGAYASKFVDVCDPEANLFGVKGGGLYYVKCSSSIPWSILRALVETNDPDGYVTLPKNINWRSLFTSSNRAKVPDALRKQGVKSMRELSLLIVPEGKTGRFRLEVKALRRNRK